MTALVFDADGTRAGTEEARRAVASGMRAISTPSFCTDAENLPEAVWSLAGPDKSPLSTPLATVL